MPEDVLLSRELKSLREELATAQQDRPGRTASGNGAGLSGESSTPTAPAERSAEELAMRSHLAELIKEITAFAEDAEKDISAHPAMSVTAAMLLGILIGSLLARR